MDRCTEMEIASTRFGRIEVNHAEVVQFPEGLPGLEDCREWVFLADAENAALAWMQSLDRPEIALAVVSPRRFVPGFQLRVARRELEPLRLDGLSDAEVLTILGKTSRAVTLNLKAPLVLNLQRRLGRQVIANGDLSMQYELGNALSAFKKTA